MATNNILTSGQFTLGPNNSIAIYDANGEVDWGLFSTIAWSSKPRINRKEIDIMAGFSYDLAFNRGWQGDITLQRYEGKFDNYWYTNVEIPVQNGAPYPTFTIIQTINETDGSISRYTFVGALITYDDAGKYSNEEGVVQTLNFTAPGRTVTIN